MDESKPVIQNAPGSPPPKLKAPANAADCHIHIYDARFKSTKPALPYADVENYRLLQRRIGVSRVVIVLARPYGTDNSVTLDAIEQLGLANARGIAVLHPTVSDAELKRLDQGGIRGIRFTLDNPQTAVVSIDMIEPLAKRIAAFGWHVQLNAPPDKVVEHQEMLRRLPTPIVFDHMGMLPPITGVKHPAFAVMRSLVDSGKAWVKVSGAFLISKAGAPYADTLETAKAFVKMAPERMVWGSDWPHPLHPDDAVLFDLLLEWAPDDATRHRILVTNPEALYGF